MTATLRLRSLIGDLGDRGGVQEPKGWSESFRASFVRQTQPDDGQRALRESAVQSAHRYIQQKDQPWGQWGILYA